MIDFWEFPVLDVKYRLKKESQRVCLITWSFPEECRFKSIFKNRILTNYMKLINQTYRIIEEISVMTLWLMNKTDKLTLEV